MACKLEIRGAQLVKQSLKGVRKNNLCNNFHGSLVGKERGRIPSGNKRIRNNWFALSRLPQLSKTVDSAPSEWWGSHVKKKKIREKKESKATGAKWSHWRDNYSSLGPLSNFPLHWF